MELKAVTLILVQLIHGTVHYVDSLSHQPM